MGRYGPLSVVPSPIELFILGSFVRSFTRSLRRATSNRAARNRRALIPASMEERADMFGLCAIILAEDGFVWNFRIQNDGALARK